MFNRIKSFLTVLVQIKILIATRLTRIPVFTQKTQIENPTIPYDPLICSRCGAVLNPYARVDYQSKIWSCPFCFDKNHFPRSYSGITEINLRRSFSDLQRLNTLGPRKSASTMTCPTAAASWSNGFNVGLKSMSSNSSFSSLASTVGGGGGVIGELGIAFVFLVDASMIRLKDANA